MVKVLFVCLGNICRSPAAEAILRDQAAQENLSHLIEVQSCGLGPWHVGHPPDARMCEASLKRGFKLCSVGQQFKLEFLEGYDYILVADQEILARLQGVATLEVHRKKLYLMTAFSILYEGEEVPDPYYAAEEGFDLVLDILEDSCRGLLEKIKKKK